jgi:hypothetical protein
VKIFLSAKKDFFSVHVTLIFSPETYRVLSVAKEISKSGTEPPIAAHERCWLVSAEVEPSQSNDVQIVVSRKQQDLFTIFQLRNSWKHRKEQFQNLECLSAFCTVDKESHQPFRLDLFELPCAVDDVVAGAHKVGSERSRCVIAPADNRVLCSKQAHKKKAKR